MINLPSFRQLRYLTALARLGHFGRAAEACHVTQSTLSAGIAEMENLLGVSLAERDRRRGVLLTEAGLALTRRAERLLAEAEDMVESARAHGAPLSGPLRLGVIPTVGPYLLPRALTALRSTYPELKLLLREEQTAPTLARLTNGENDAAVIALPYPLTGMAQAVIADDPFYFVCEPNHPLARRKNLKAEEIGGAELLLLEDGHCLREHALAACPLSRAAGAVQATSLPTLIEMAAGGIGPTVLPKIAIDAGALEGTGLVAHPLDAEEKARQIALVWRATSARGAEFHALADSLRRALRTPRKRGQKT